MQTTTMKQRLALLGSIFMVAIALAACGGGGSSSSSTTTTSTNSSSSSTATNQVTLTVAAGAENIANMPTTSVTVCATSGSPCQTINNVLVDTGSYGLRLVNSAASSVLSSLTAETTSSGAELAECGQFVSTYTWGSVRLATVELGGETASSVPIQILGDLSATAPSSCSDGLTEANTVSAVGANGILGVGTALNDCGATCASSAVDSTYYSCPSGSNCTQTTVAQSSQVANVVSKFSSDNNGIVITLGSPSGGTASGTMTFGLGTQSDNAVGSSATKLTTDGYGDLTGALSSTAYATSFLDTGSNGLYFNAPSSVSLPTCSDDTDFYCPTSTVTMAGTLTGENGSSSTISVAVANADTLYATNGYALADLGGPFGYTGYLDLGLPFFFGRTIYFGFDLSSTTGTSPYVAF
jgi:hypothetical protein